MALEMVLVLSLLVLMAGALAPLLVSQINREKVALAKNSMENLAQAVERFYRDTQTLPPNLRDLVAPAQGAQVEYNNWQGPYFCQGVVEGDAGNSICDAWGKPYEVEILSADTMQITSYGVDRQKGTADDLRRTVSVRAWVFAQKTSNTMAEMAIINSAITDYYELYVDAQKGNPLLSGDWREALVQLQNAGLLPNFAEVTASPYYADEWEAAYRCETPCRRVWSVTLQGDGR